MNTTTQFCHRAVLVAAFVSFLAAPLAAEDPAAAPAADSAAAPKLVTGEGEGWKPMSFADFDNFNGNPETWSEKDGIIHCTGRPTGVARSKKQYKNFEMVLEWRHLNKGGNSGVFVWAPERVFNSLRPGRLPGGGIEVQVLDHGYEEQYKKSTGKDGDWFTTNGDVFPVGGSRMKPFPPLSPDGSRSFPKAETTKGTPEWNHYYIIAKDGEIRLTVNGVEVSGGEKCEPNEGFLCLESEGAPVEFRNIRMRELP